MATTLDLKSKEEKDAELDKRIEALRRKNEALIRRYQEIEEDRKKAELEGVAVTAPRKSRSMEKEKGRVGNPSKSFTLWEVQLSGDHHDLHPLPSCPRHDETVGPEGST